MRSISSVTTSTTWLRNVSNTALKRFTWFRIRLLENFTTDGYTKVMKQLIDEYKPEIVLYGATHIGRDFAPRIAARCNTGLTADCTHLDVKVSKYIEFAKANTTLDTSTLDPNDPSTGIKQTRPAFGGNLMATIICPKTRPQMSTVSPGVMQKQERAVRS